MGTRLVSWAGRPQPHVVGLFLSVVAVLAIVAFMVATLEYSKTRGRLLLTALLVGGYFLTMLAASGITRQGWGPMVRLPAMIAPTVAILLMVLGLWGPPDSDGFWQATATVTVLAVGLVATGLVLPFRNARHLDGTIASAAGVASIALTAMAILGIALEIRAVAFWWSFVVLALLWFAACVLRLVVGVCRGRRRREVPG